MTKENKAWNRGAHLMLMVFCIICIVPFLILFSSSVSNVNSIIREGYSLLPRDLDFSAYQYLWSQSSTFIHAFGVSVFITIVGTTFSLTITSLMAYPLSRKYLPGRKFFTFFVIFSLLFNGGLVPTYIVYSQFIHIKDTIFALIVPGLLMNGFFVLLMRTFFMTSIPEEIVEAARLDGAGEFRIFRSVIIPLSLPVLATVGLFQAVAYWNDWFNALIYVSDPKLLGLQPVLNQMLNNINFLSVLAKSGMSTTTTGMAVNIPSTTVRMAVAFIGVLPILIAYPFFQKLFVKGITFGGIKG